MNKNSIFGALVTGQTISELKLADVRPDPEQPRKHFDSASVQELADSIAQQGLLQPILVRRDPADKKKYIIISGERRFRAFGLLPDKTTIEAIIRDDGNTQVMAIIENLQRVDLSPIEEAEAIARLMNEQNMTQETVAKVIGKKRVSVTDLLAVNGLPAVIREEASKFGVSKSVLVELARVGDADLQMRLWKESGENGLTVAQIKGVKSEAKKVKGQGRRNDVRRPTSVQKALVQLNKAVGMLEGQTMDESARAQVQETIVRLSAL